jgi:plasmid segregation protein ParM
MKGINKMYIVAGDIGYGNLKTAFGHSDNQIERSTVRTSLVASTDMLPDHLLEKKSNRHIPVFLDGEEYMVGLDPDSIVGLDRQLHNDYIETDEYRALFLASLAMQPLEHIDIYVTGLPVSHSLDKEKRDTLKSRLTGKHVINNERTVNVKKVMVYPQPYGTYSMLMEENKKFKNLLQYGSVMIIDIGRFSVDHIMLYRGKFQQEVAGTTQYATESIFNRTMELIEKDHGVSLDLVSIEMAVLNNEEVVFANGKEIKIEPYFKKASSSMSAKALSAIKRDLVKHKNIDFILLTGGGAPFFLEETKKSFKNCNNIEVANKSVLANARGYWYAARGKK